MSSSASTSPLRQILETRISQLSVEMEGLFAEARERGRRESADQLNQAVRRIRQAADLEELRAILLDAAAAFSTGAALFRDRRAGRAGRTHPRRTEEAAEAFGGLEIPLASAAALAGAVETRDPVIAVTSAGEVSARDGEAGRAPAGWARLDLPGGGTGARARPGVRLGNGAGIRPGIAEPGGGGRLERDLDTAGSRGAAGAGPDRTRSRTEPPAPPVAPSAPPPPAASAWDGLPPREQQIHLRAQRFARVQVAEMRLREADAVQSGRAQHNLYAALRQPIDAARAAFREISLRRARAW